MDFGDSILEKETPYDCPKENPQSAKPAEQFPDIRKLRLSQQFLETAGVKKVLTTVPVRRPNRQDFIRVHHDAAYREAFATIELKEDRERYLLLPHITEALPGEFNMEMFYTAINRQKVIFLWPVRLPSPDGRINEWHRSAQEAAERAMSRWIRVTPNMSLGAYEIFEAEGKIPDPEWLEYSFQEFLQIALRDRIIDSFDHPVLKRLRGAS